MQELWGFPPPPAFAATYGHVDTSIKDGAITIGNDAISRTFSFKDGNLKTTLIDNKLGHVQIVPGAGSEEFVIEGMVEGKRQEPESALTSVKPGRAGQTAVKASASSEEMHDNGTHPASAAIDGDDKTYWASTETADKNVWFELDFGSQKTIKKIVYTPRFDNSAKYECTGQIGSFEIQVQENGQWVTKETIALKTGKDHGKQEHTLSSAITAQKIRIKVKTSYHWSSEKKDMVGNIAEIDIFDDKGASVIHSNGASGAWSIETNSDKGTSDGGGIQAFIDGNMDSYWHCDYNNNKPTQNPVTVTLDRGDSQKDVEFQTVGYAGRKNGASTNGNFQEFEVYASDSKDKLFEEANRKDTCKVRYTGAYDNGAHKMVYCGLDKPVTGRYVGIKVTKGQGGFAAGAELGLFKEKFDSVPEVDAGSIKASAMKVVGEPKVETTTATIQGAEKIGKLVTFAFEPVKFGNGNATVEQKVVMYDGDHFMRKWLEIKSEDQDIRLKYIDGEHLDLSSVKATDRWTIPTNAGGVVQMDMQKSILGQPFYANGMFFGSEFPAADTQIVENTGRARYWSGKNFKDFARDDAATYTGLNDEGEYVSWQTVCGATHAGNLDMNLIQIDFFDYINSISEPSEFRIQYNSWFDNMMRINNENIIESFYEIDKGFSETGVRPIENYVVDDGWNQYRQTAGSMSSQIDIERNGPVTEVNTAGFWQINSKFGGTLNESSSLVKKLGSSFGVWIGPRGGYNYFGTLADIIEKAGNGSKAGGSIDVADTRYVKKFEDFAIDMMEKYGVSYWKWDGFADGGQFGAFASGEETAGYDEKHQHMYGGPNGYFHVTDLWEKWCLLLSNVQQKADELKLPNFWVSLTCYVNPSPWYLQFSNSVWMQCNADRGERYNAGELTDKMNAMLTYRDGVYYDFIKNHQFQFPLANIYNHDPIYGKEDTGITADSMNGEQFRNYLFMQGARGTAFWELYYSDSLFNDEKYLVNADFLKWEEENFDMLRNAKVIGGTPAASATLAAGNGLGGGEGAKTGEQNAYGFACFNAAGDEGVISMRNPAFTDKTIEFKIDDAIGAKGDSYKRVVDHAYTTKAGDKIAESKDAYKKGETVSVTLKPGETQIWHLSKNGDTAAPTFHRLYTQDNTTLRVQVSEHVYGAQFEVFINGEKVELDKDAVKAYADLKTFDIALPKAPANGAKIEVKAIAGSDSAGNDLAGSITRTFHTDGIIGMGTEGSCPSIAGKDSVEGLNGFSASATVKNAVANTVLVSQGNEWSLGINAEGKASFTVNGVSAVSDVTVAGTATITGVRENNGMLKVYVNGTLAGSNYNEAARDHSVKHAKISANFASGVSKATVYDYALGYDEVPASPLADLIKTVEAAKDKVTPESWNAANMDSLLAAAKEALKGTDAAAQQAAYDNLLAGYNKLIPGLGAPKVVNVAQGKKASAHWKKDGSNASNNNQRPVDMAVDGKKDSTDNYGEFGADNKAESSYLQVDLGDVYDVTKLHLVRYFGDGRTYPNTTIVLSEDDTFYASDTVAYNSDAENKNGFGKGTDQAYAESKEGRDFDAKGAKARYVRVYMNGREQNKGTTNHVVELEVFAPQKVDLGDPYGVDSLDALIARAEAAVKDADAYTQASLDKVKEALEVARPLSEKLHKEIETGKFTVSFGEFDAACSALRNALNCLEEIPGVDLTPIGPSEPVPGKPSVPGTGDAKPQNPGKPSVNGGLPQTGDPSAVVAFGTAAVAMIGMGAALKKRRS